MTRLRNISLLLLVLFAFNACDDVRPYAARVNGKRITAAEIEMFYRAYRTFDPSASQLEVHDSKVLSHNVSSYVLNRLLTAKAVAGVLKAKGIDTTANAEEKFLELVSTSAPPDVLEAWKKLSPAERKLIAETFVALDAFQALDAGVKTDSIATITCSEVGQFQSAESATVAATAAKAGKALTTESGAAPSKYCISNVGEPVNGIDDAIRKAKPGDVVGPITEQGQGGIPVFLVAKITSQKNVAFKDWPLQVMQKVPPVTPGVLSPKLKKQLDVQINPAFGRKPTTQAESAQCTQFLVCVLPPVNPTQPNNASLN